jgi:hypothetical protein
MLGRQQPSTSRHIMVATYAVALLSWLWLLAPEAKAARSYEVELLIFEHQHQDDDETLIPQFGRSVDLRFSLEQAERRVSTIQPEPALDGHLADINARLTASRAYDVLYHVRWLQQSARLPHAPRVGISLPASSTRTGIHGIVRLYATDLLFVDTIMRFDLVPSTHSNQSGASAERSVHFLKQKRRVKFKEVHYIDHPRFGLLITVWPVNH